jgi:hypothetical protein
MPEEHSPETEHRIQSRATFAYSNLHYRSPRALRSHLAEVNGQGIPGAATEDQIDSNKDADRL